MKIHVETIWEKWLLFEFVWLYIHTLVYWYLLYAHVVPGYMYRYLQSLIGKEKLTSIVSEYNTDS